ncbi:GAF domain-containing protein [Streptomyces sp. H10-C2]|uniref:GAF domain-containing protein n=1 Tax=unclassified Streptomyces TaxID=2593676 RepID=UPI0024B9F839|nr:MULTISPECIES: GAF domain-containing protein [unclassified Streptomyces]MDJ0340920.1 GAF domain-containing protein [Streptomyces sp. PH10-H1]MDJ0369848.1 GAF domain-containing protein [Streptomyces sp. H10-C2]
MTICSARSARRRWSLRACPQRIPALLCTAAVDLLSVSGASISLMNGRGESRALLCSSGPVAARLAELQSSLGDGPCRRAFERGAAVCVDDLERGPDAQRWPVFAQGARELGVRAVYSFPLAVGAIAAGTLDLYRTVAGALSEPELRVALLVADAVTAAVLRLHTNEDMSGSSNGDVPWAAEAEGSHDEVHQATGFLALHTVPLRLHERTVGSVGLFFCRAGDATDANLHLVQAMADVAVLTVCCTGRPSRGR